MIAADRALDHDDRATTSRWLLATIALGALFLANQIPEYATLTSGPATIRTARSTGA